MTNNVTLDLAAKKLESFRNARSELTSSLEEVEELIASSEELRDAIAKALSDLAPAEEQEAPVPKKAAKKAATTRKKREPVAEEVKAEEPAIETPVEPEVEEPAVEEAPVEDEVIADEPAETAVEEVGGLDDDFDSWTPGVEPDETFDTKLSEGKQASSGENTDIDFDNINF